MKGVAWDHECDEARSRLGVIRGELACAEQLDMVLCLPFAAWQ